MYGNGRIAQANSTTEYFLADALGSVRQLVDMNSAVTLTQSYAPYGEVTQSIGNGATAYQFTGEMRDANGLIYLRARYYAPQDGRFLSRDTWGGDYNRPASLNRWGYVEGNPVNLVDPSGFYARTVAVHRALAHDLMDPFPVRGYDWNEQGTDCTSFASYVLWEGGIRDSDDRKPKYIGKNNIGQDIYDDKFLTIPYWNGDWAQVDEPNWTYGGVSFNSWMNTSTFFDFLTIEKKFTSYIVMNDSNLQNTLHGIPFDIGDLVFYSRYHVAVITDTWAPKTFFGGFPPIQDPIKLKNIAREIWRYTRCDGDAEWLPRVVERSGAILYHRSRSINNTFTPQSFFVIVHVE